MYIVQHHEDKVKRMYIINKETRKVYMAKILVTNGDSWTFGSEIIAPEFCINGLQPSRNTPGEFKPGVYDWSECNNSYRIDRIWPTHLGNMLGVNKTVNLAIPARSNDSIYESTISWLLENYVQPQRDTSELLVIVGWSSPERKNIIINDSDDVTKWFTIWPAMQETKYYTSHTVREFFKFYVSHMWLEQEYIKRFVEQNYNFQLFCNAHKIPYIVFNAFYNSPDVGPEGWNDLTIADSLKAWDSLTMCGDQYHNWKTMQSSLSYQWGALSDINYIFRDSGSFKSYIDKHVDINERMCNFHPSPKSHYCWADFLSTYIGEHFE